MYRDPYKKNYKRKVDSGNHFHNVLCLSEAKGMDIKKMNSITLINGGKVPVIGYGPGIILSPKMEIKELLHGNMKRVYKDMQAISTLTRIGKTPMTMIDTSASYEYSQVYIGNVIRKNRDRYYIVSKVSNKAQFSSSVEQEFEKTIRELKVDYLDLYLLHWPVQEHFLDSWKVLEKLYRSGRCRAIGVANCNIHHLEEIKEIAQTMPMVNQIECHPLFLNDATVKYCNDNDIRVMAYTPTARMDDRLKGTQLPALAAKYNKSIAQIILKWHIQQGRIPIVNTSQIKHLYENCNIFDFQLTKSEIELINAANINSRLRYDPDNCDFTKL